MLLSFLRRPPRLVVGVGVALASWLASSAASAQTIGVVNEQSLPRLDKDGNPVQKRALTLNPEGVSNQDCIDDQKIRFTLLLSGFTGNATLEAWAGLSGADCKTQTARQSGTQVCWQLATGIPLQQTVNVDIPVRKIMSGVPPFKATEPVADETACGKVDLATVGVHFLYFAPGELATAATDKTLQVKVDTVGPSPPSGLSVLPGNTRIQVSWDNISGEGGVSVLTGVKVYCDPAGGGGTTTTTDDAGTERVCTDVPIEAGDDAGDGGDGGDAGTTQNCVDVPIEAGTSGGASGGACSSSNFTTSDGSKVIPDDEFNANFECGSFSGNSGTTAVATSLRGASLVNGTQYAVAVAATDAFGNVGPLSGVICETPEVTKDFWDSYKAAGGEAGGGFCATAGPGLPVGTMSVFGVVALAAGSLVRRRWRKRR